MESKHYKLFKNENKYCEHSLVKIKQHQKHLCLFFIHVKTTSQWPFHNHEKNRVTWPGFLTANVKNKLGIISSWNKEYSNLGRKLRYLETLCETSLPQKTAKINNSMLLYEPSWNQMLWQQIFTPREILRGLHTSWPTYIVFVQIHACLIQFSFHIF